MNDYARPAIPVAPGVWIVTLRLREDIRPTLNEALTLAIAEGEGKGWA